MFIMVDINLNGHVIYIKTKDDLFDTTEIKYEIVNSYCKMTILLKLNSQILQ